MMSPLKSILIILSLASYLQAGETLTVGSANGASGAVTIMPVGVQKTDPVCGLQFQVNYPSSHVETGTPNVAGSSNHTATGSDDQMGKMIVVIYSVNNTVIPADIDIQIPLSLLSNSPTGGPSVSISDITFTDAMGNGFTSAITYPLIETWRRTNFTLAQRADPNIIGDNANPDNDALPNLLELLMGGDPHVADFSILPPVSFEVDSITGKKYLRIKFNLLKDSAIRAAILANGEVSSDLTIWDSASVTTTPTGIQTATTEEVEAEVEVTGESKKFLRITGTRTPGN